MLVSVIVPTYNRAHIIARPLGSIIRQTYRDIEIIVVDDGSTDNTADVVEELARKSQRQILYEKKPNRGCASARNRGIQLATGDLIAFLDSDDAWEENALETLVSELIRSGADFIYSPAVEMYENGTEVINYPVAANHPEAFAIEHFKVTNTRNGSLLFRRKVFAKIPGMDERLTHNEDSDFLQRVAIHFHAAYSNVPTVRVFHHDGKKSENRVAIYTALLKSAENILSDYPDFLAILGEIAAKRIVEIKSHLVESLILAGNFREAREMAKTIKDHLDIPTRISLITGSSMPARIMRIWKNLAAGV